MCVFIQQIFVHGDFEYQIAPKTIIVILKATKIIHDLKLHFIIASVMLASIER